MLASVDQTQISKKHLPALDGLRGVLALVVTVQHAFDDADIRVADALLPVCVWIFFILSGCVLTRGWNGRYLIFLARRIVRLWPVHLFCLGLLVLIGGRPIRAADIFLFPWAISDIVHEWHLANPPSWSMCVEVAAMPFMPFVVFCARRGLIWVALGCAVSVLLAAMIHPFFIMMPFFLIGGGLAACPPSWPLLEKPAARWLGSISYSLYLSHAVVLYAGERAFGPHGSLVVLPAVLPFAWLVWRWVEQPSVVLSRRLARP